ncbi:hypothetical protein ACPV51_23665, partial [Vibrio astriarenae]
MDGYGLRDDDPLQKAAKNPNSGKLTPISFEEYKKSVAPYTVEKASEISGVEKEKLIELAKQYA